MNYSPSATITKNPTPKYLNFCYFAICKYFGS